MQNVLQLFVCLAVTSQSSIKTAKRVSTLTTPRDSERPQFADAKDLHKILIGSFPVVCFFLTIGTR